MGAIQPRVCLCELKMWVLSDGVTALFTISTIIGNIER